MNGIGPSIVSLLGWQAAGGINPVGIFTFNPSTLDWEPQAPITGGAGGGPATIADGADVAQGSTGDAPGTNTVVGKLKQIAAALTNPLPVSGAFFQATQPISAAALPLPAGAATEATLATRLADATFTGRFPAAAALADGAVNPTVTQIGADNLLWNGATWDRAQGGADNADAVAVAALGRLFAAARAYAFNGATFDRLRCAGDNADAVAVATLGQLIQGARNYGFNGTTWDRLRSKIAAGLAVEPTPALLNIVVTGGANAIATATLPAAGAGLFHYITHISIKRVATALLAGGALLTVTSTNLGGRAWRTGNQASITVAPSDPFLLIDQEYSHPLRSAVANTASTIVCPAAGAAVSWQINVDYYTAP